MNTRSRIREDNAPRRSPRRLLLNLLLAGLTGTVVASDQGPRPKVQAANSASVADRPEVARHHTATALSSLTYCSPNVPCDGHATVKSSAFPYTEDLTSNQVTISGPSFDWVLVQSKCDYVPGNIDASQTAHALLRGLIETASGNVSPGARLEVQLRVDGIEHGWYVKRLNGVLDNLDQMVRVKYPDTFIFEGTAQDLTAGAHVFELWARLLDAGHVTTGFTWITATGVPAAAYPSGKVVDGGLLNVSTAWQPVTPYLTFTFGPVSPFNSSLLDLSLQGYVQVNQRYNGASKLIFGFSLDGQPAIRQPAKSVSSTLYDGINLVDHLRSVSPGYHTLRLWAKTDAGSVDLQSRQVEYVGFPGDNANSPGGEPPSATDTVHVDPLDAGTAGQPIAAVLSPGCGNWSLLGSFDIPARAGGQDWSWTLEGYVQLLGNRTGGTVGQVAFETISYFPDQDPMKPPVAVPVDMGLHFFQIPAGEDGLWFYGDAGDWGVGISPPGSTVRLWIRQVYGCNLNDSAGGFDVGMRYFSAKVVPFDYPNGTACAYRNGLDFYSLTPCRLIDTRLANGSLGGPALAAGQNRAFPAAGTCGVPATAKALSVNVAAIEPSSGGSFSLFGGSGSPPPTPTLRFSANQTRANNAMVLLGADGNISISCGIPSGTAHAILDVNGYFQ